MSEGGSSVENILQPSSVTYPEIYYRGRPGSLERNPGAEPRWRPGGKSQKPKMNVHVDCGLCKNARNIRHKQLIIVHYCQSTGQ